MLLRAQLFIYLICQSFHFNLLFTLVPVWFPAACGSVQADINGSQDVCRSYLSKPMSPCLQQPHPPLRQPGCLQALSVAGITVLHLAFFCSPGRSLHRNLQSPEPGLFWMWMFTFSWMCRTSFILAGGVRRWTVLQLDLVKGSVLRAILGPRGSARLLCTGEGTKGRIGDRLYFLQIVRRMTIPKQTVFPPCLGSGWGGLFKLIFEENNKLWTPSSQSWQRLVVS